MSLQHHRAQGKKEDPSVSRKMSSLANKIDMDFERREDAIDSARRVTEPLG